MKLLITGGAGFIGSSLACRAARDGVAVRSIDRRPGRPAGVPDALADAVEWVEADLLDRAACERACRGVDAILHHAAEASVTACADDPLAAQASNVTATVQLLTVAREAGVRRVVFASSCSVYGDAHPPPQRESAPAEPASLYAVSKLAGELYALAFDDPSGMRTLALRYFNVYGPGQGADSPYAAVIPKWLEAAASGASATIDGDGEQTRDFVFIDDVVAANFLALSANKSAYGRTYNIGSGRATSINELHRAISRAIGGTPVPPTVGPARAGDVRHSLAVIDEARERLRYEPETTLSDGLRRTAEWFLARR